MTQPKKVAEEKEEKEKTEEGTAVDTTKPALEKKDSIAEALICQICQVDYSSVCVCVCVCECYYSFLHFRKSCTTV